MKFLNLTVYNKVLNESAETRLDTYLVDSSGRGFEEWDDLGLTPSKELLEKEKEVLDIKDEDYEISYLPSILNLSAFECAVDDVEGGSIVFTKSGTSLIVTETCEEIQMQIWCLQRSLFEKIKMWIK